MGITREKKTSKKFDVYSVKQDMIYNYADFYKPFFKKVVVNTRKEKFAISKYRLFQYSKEHMRVVRCSVNSLGAIYSDFCIQKNVEIPLAASPALLYDAPIKIKNAKVKDILALAEKYVPLSDKWFYDQLSLNNPSIANEAINASDSGTDIE